MSRLITIIGCGYAVALWIAAAFFGLSDDLLFFHSDRLSKAYVLAALGFLLLPLPLVVIGVSAAALRRVDAVRIAGAFPLVLVLAGLLMFGGEWAFGKITTFAAYLAALGAAIAAAAILVWRLPDRDTALDRAAYLSRVILLVALPVTVACGAYFHLSARAAGAVAPRHVVMILVDGMPSQLLSSYDPAVPPTELDRVAARGCTIRHAFTNRTYTNGYFAVFYTGRYDRSAKDSAGALPLRLDRDSAGFRWIGFHANGFPETARITGYRGLRSALLSDEWVWLPRLLGLHRHVFVTWDSTRRYMGDRVNTLYEALNGRTNEERIWGDLLPREVEDMQARFDRSFLLLHVSTSKHTVQAMEDGEFGDASAEIEALLSHAAAHDYTYRPDQQSVVRRYQDTYRTRIDVFGRRLAAFLDGLERAGLAKDTLVIFTADHGSTFRDGHLWYGHHADEEVARVPLFLFGDGLSCRTDLMADTLDLRATIDRYLGLRDTVPTGRDLLAPSGAQKPLHVLNSRNDPLKTMYLQIRPAPGVRYLFNLHPDGDGRAVKGRVDGYDVADAPIGDDPRAWTLLRDALAETGIAIETIHPALRERIAKATQGG